MTTAREKLLKNAFKVYKTISIINLSPKPHTLSRRARQFTLGARTWEGNGHCSKVATSYTTQNVSSLKSMIKKNPHLKIWGGQIGYVLLKT